MVAWQVLRFPTLLLHALALTVLPSCRSPTSVTLVLSSDVECADAPTTAVAVSRADSESLAPSLVTHTCQPDGTIGTVVVVPAADKDEDLRVRVVTRIKGATCEGPTYGTGCIVSRRQLRFIAHEELSVPIAQQVDCAGVACGATTTCRQGSCVAAQVDQGRCEDHPAQCGIEIVPGTPPGNGGAGQSGAGGQGGMSGSSGQAGGAGGASGSAGAGGGVGVLHCVGHGAPVAKDTSLTATRHVTPQGSGDKSGSDWDNAGTLGDIPGFVGKLPPGGQVLIHSGLGAYTWSKAIPMTKGGAAGKPIVIRGVDASGNEGAKPMIVGSRQDPFTDPKGAGGVEVFRLLPGADHLVFRNLAFRSQGNGCFRFGGSVSDITIASMQATNVNRFIDTTPSGSETSVSLSAVTVRDVDVRGYAKGVVWLRDDSHDILISDVYGDSEAQPGDDFCEGVSLAGTVHDVDIVRTTMLNCHDTTMAAGSYWNGDGFTAEAKTHDLCLEQTHAAGHDDSGYSIKGSATQLWSTTATGSKRNYSFLGTAALHGASSSNAFKRGGNYGGALLWAGKSAVVTADQGTFSQDTSAIPVFTLEDQASVTVTSSVVILPDPSKLSSIAPTATLSLTDTPVKQP